jgi:hypothetical protein
MICALMPAIGAARPNQFRWSACMEDREASLFNCARGAQLNC